MMFASDLDRTLIYSQGALAEYPTKVDLELIPVEQKLDKSVSFMTKHSLQYLQMISKKLLFVPVTTRSLIQYKRVFLHNTDNLYAVTSNGANILYKGSPMSDWTGVIEKEMSEGSVPLEELRKFVSKQFHIPGDLREVESLFFYYYLNGDISRELVNDLDDFISNKGWRLSHQGKKLYLVPQAISKGRAVRFIQEREEITTLIGAGDSLFDDDFLTLCHHPFVLGHGELAQLYPLKEHYTIIEHLGATGGEELLRTIYNLVEQNK